MDLIALLKEVVAKMDMILSEYGYNQEKAQENQQYRLLKETSDNLSKGIQEVEKAKFLNQSFVFVNEPYVSENLEDYVDWDLIEKVKVNI